MHDLPDNNGGVGLHLFIDIHGVKPEPLMNLEFIKEMMVKACQATGANVLSVHGHSFGEGMGVTSVVVLSESHGSIHTWPEKNLAVMDFFTCGTCNPRLAIPVLFEALDPEVDAVVDLIYRGVPPMRYDVLRRPILPGVQG